MILLHRLSYLMYNNENIKPSQVLVITPSDSFNAFIDELAQILELERVKTVTLENYYARLLKSAGIDLEGRVDYLSPVDEDYLKYIYSPQFAEYVDKKLTKIYSDVRGMLPSDRGDEFVASILKAINLQQSEYEKIKNAGTRVRRCVLGEIKEKPDGGLYYTKQMRNLFNCINEIKEFLCVNRTDAKMDGYYYFYRQLLSFYKSLKSACVGGQKICRDAENDLSTLYKVIDKEIEDLKRYKQHIGDKVEYTYPDRIAKREETKREIERTKKSVSEISEKFAYLSDFYEVVRGEKNLVKIGSCGNGVELARYFYREIVKPVKSKYGLQTKKLIRSDAFALCLLLKRLGYNLTPAYSFVFVDEAQDISPTEYGLLKQINSEACFNLFGDLKQNITGYRGVEDWSHLNMQLYELDLNYRNTNMIVSFVSDNLNVKMQTIGLEGEAVKTINARGVSSYLSDKAGLRAVITSEANLQAFTRKSYNLVRDSGVISKNKINLLTVYESKGLEFTAVAVADEDMTDNEKYIAYTRALKDLAIIR